jgi:hypothetical protein
MGIGAIIEGQQYLLVQGALDPSPAPDEWLVLQFDRRGDSLEFRVWRPDEEFPKDALLQATDDRLNSGGVAAYYHTSVAGVEAIYEYIWVFQPPEIPRGKFSDVRNTGFSIGVNTGSTELNPVVSPDGTELYYDIFQSLDDDDMWVATRNGSGELFRDPKNVQELAADGIVLNTASIEAPGCISPDLRELYFLSWRDGTSDIFVATRAGPEAEFDTLEKLGPKVNSLDRNEGGSRISCDGLLLYYHSNVGPNAAAIGRSDIWIAERRSTGDLFGALDGPNPRALGVNSPIYDQYGPSISCDGRFLFFCDWAAPELRQGGFGLYDIWVTVRSSAEGRFQDPVHNLNVLWPGSTVNSVSADALPFISADWPAYGSKLYFISTRAGIQGGCDIWEATWNPIPPLPPRNLTATPGDGKVNLAWEPADGGEPAVGYNIYRRCKPSATREKLNAEIVLETKYTDSSVTNGEECCYYVKGVSQHGDESSFSSAECVTVGPPLVLFRRGDSNADGNLDLSDAVRVLGYLFLGEATPTCLDACDSNDDGNLDLSDPVYALGFLFLGGAAPPDPGPVDCGPDPTDDDELGCEAYACDG